MVPYFYRFHDRNDYENYESYLGQFFHYILLTSELEYHYAQLKLVGESFAWHVNNYKSRSGWD